MPRGELRRNGLGREVVLGLVVERPDNCYQLDQRLRQRFRSAEFARGTASQAMKQLLKDGFVQEQRSSKRLALAGGHDATVYEATEDGVAHFRAWIRAGVRSLPVREELIAKVGLCQPEDVPRMIEVVREAETVLMGRLQSLNFRVRARRGDLDLRRWETRIELAVSSGDHAALDSRVKWVQELHRHLVEELSDGEGPLPGSLQRVR